MKNRPTRRPRRAQRKIERRSFSRYRLPLPLTVTAQQNGRARLLERGSTLENISAGGVCFALERATTEQLPHGTELEIVVPLVEMLFRPGRVYARCRARVVRRQEPGWVAAAFDQVEFVREERLSGLPLPVA